MKGYDMKGACKFIGRTILELAHVQAHVESKMVSVAAGPAQHTGCSSKEMQCS